MKLVGLTSISYLYSLSISNEYTIRITHFPKMYDCTVKYYKIKSIYKNSI